MSTAAAAVYSPYFLKPISTLTIALMNPKDIVLIEYLVVAMRIVDIVVF